LAPENDSCQSRHRALFALGRDILKRLAIQQSRNAIPQRMLTASVTAPPVPINAPKRVAGAAGWTEESIQDSLFRADPRKEADWSMGDDAPPAFPFRAPRTLWDYCKSNGSRRSRTRRRPVARNPRDVSRCSLERWNHAASPPDFGRAALAASVILDPSNESILLFLPPTGVPGARCSFAQLSATPLSGSGAGATLSPIVRSMPIARAACPACDRGGVESDGSRRLVGCAADCRIGAGPLTRTRGAACGGRASAVVSIFADEVCGIP